MEDGQVAGAFIGGMISGALFVLALLKIVTRPKR